MILSKKNKTNNFFIIDSVKMNHWLNARKMTTHIIAKDNKNLANKIQKEKNFSASPKEIIYLSKKLNITSHDITVRKKLPEFIFSSKKKNFRIQTSNLPRQYSLL